MPGPSVEITPRGDISGGQVMRDQSGGGLIVSTSAGEVITFQSPVQWIGGETSI